MIREKDLKIRKNDIFLTALIIVVCVAFAVFPLLFSADGLSVLIYVDGEFFAEKSLYENSETDVQGLMKVVIKNGEAYVEDSVCPNGSCEHSSAVSSSGESIICLPNKIIIKISGETEMDAISS